MPVIANHQSFIDILVLLALTPKLVMITNHWVWHSPFFGAIIRYADFYYVGDGYELYVERMAPKGEGRIFHRHPSPKGHVPTMEG